MYKLFSIFLFRPFGLISENSHSQTKGDFVIPLNNSGKDYNSDNPSLRHHHDCLGFRLRRKQKIAFDRTTFHHQGNEVL